MVFIISFTFLFISSLIWGILINPIGFIGFIFNFLIFILFKEKIIKNLNKNKIILIILIIFLIIFKILITSIIKNENNEIPKNNKFYISEKYKNSYIINDFKNNKIILNKKYFLNNKYKNLELEINDEINNCLKINKLTYSNKYFKSKNIKFKAFIYTKNCKLNIKKTKNLRSKIIKYFKKIKNEKFIKWIKFLIFQEKSEKLNIFEEKTKNLNINHLFIISGFHLFTFSWIWIFFSKKTKNKIIKFFFKIIGFSFCVFLTYLTNWKLSTTKSLIILFWILFFKKNTKTYEFISFLGILYLIYNPLFIIRIDFQLSFLASFWCSLLYGNTKNKNLKDWLINILKINFLIFILLLPITLNINYKFSIFSVLNTTFFSILIIFFYPIFFILIWILPIYNFIFYIINLFEKIIIFFDSFNIEIITGEIKWYLILIYYSSFIFLFYLKEKNKIKTLLIFIILITFSFFIINTFKYKNVYKLIMFNTNHGLSMLLTNRHKKINILFDAGINKFKKNNENDLILKNLLKLGIKKLDAVFISHKHIDHYNNLIFLKKKIKIEKIYNNNFFQKKYLIKNINIKNLSFPFFKKENNKSLILNFSINNKNILLPFDIEEKVEKLLINKLDHKIDFLQVAHHGSKTSSSINFIKKIKPRVCFISSNKKSKIKNRLINNGCKVYNTSENGNLTIFFDKNLNIETEF